MAIITESNYIVVVNYVTGAVILSQPISDDLESVSSLHTYGDYVVGLIYTYPCIKWIWKLNRTTGLLQPHHPDPQEPENPALSLFFLEPIDERRLLIGFVHDDDLWVESDDEGTGHGCHVVDLETGVMSQELFRLPTLNHTRLFSGGSKLAFVRYAFDDASDRAPAVTLDASNPPGVVKCRQVIISLHAPVKSVGFVIRNVGIYAKRVICAAHVTSAAADQPQLRFSSTFLRDSSSLIEVQGPTFPKDFYAETNWLSLKFLPNCSFVACNLTTEDEALFQFCKISL
jgi:hypothetical protein